jgi:hypothetical protein
MADHYTAGLTLMDESFDLRETRNYELAIFLADESFTCCIHDFKRNKFIGLQQFNKSVVKQLNASPVQKVSYGDFLDDVCGDFPWLQGTFKLVKIAYDGRKSTLVPAPVFDPEEKDNYLKFNFQPGAGEQVFYDHLVPLDSFLLFAMPDALAIAACDHFPDTRIVHMASVLIESIWINYKNRIDVPHVFLHLREKLFDIMIFDGRQMSYFNTFPFQNPEDVTYYLIFVMEQLSFNPEKVPLVLLGNIEKGSDLNELLFRYVRHVEFGRRNDAYKYSYALNQMPPYAQYPLFNFFSCGL